MPKGPNSIPDRWLDYKPVGEAIEGTRFIPFKVPLKQHLHDVNNITEDQSFTPSNLFEVLSEKQLELGLLIDLTFTTRYYNNEEITSNGVKYEKVFTAGHQVPDRHTVNRFTEVVKEFEEKNADNDLLIGVHCTHGVNRTGYLICRYMIEHLKFTPDDALKAYEKARGYPVERPNYIADLKTRPREDDSDEDETNSEPHRRPYHKRRDSDWSNDWQNSRSRPDRRRYQPYQNRWNDSYRNNYYDDNGDGYYRNDYRSSYGRNDYGYQDYDYNDRCYSSGPYWNQGRAQGGDRGSNYYDEDSYRDSRRRGNMSNGGKQKYGQEERYQNNSHRYKWPKKR